MAENEVLGDTSSLESDTAIDTVYCRVERCWKMLKDVDRCWKMLKDVESLKNWCREVRAELQTANCAAFPQSNHCLESKMGLAEILILRILQKMCTSYHDLLMLSRNIIQYLMLYMLCTFVHCATSIMLLSVWGVCQPTTLMSSWRNTSHKSCAAQCPRSQLGETDHGRSTDTLRTRYVWSWDEEWWRAAVFLQKRGVRWKVHGCYGVLVSKKNVLCQTVI